MKEVLIAYNNVYAAKADNAPITGADEINLLAPGSIAVFDESGALIDPANPSAALTGDRVYMAVGLSTGSPWLTSLIDRASLEYSITNYIAPDAKVMWIGQDSSGDGALNMPTTLVVGSTATVVIYDKSKAPSEWNKASRVYNYVIKTGDNVKAVVDGLVALINADAKAIVTAANVADLGISITGDVNGVDFAVTVQNILETATLTHSNTDKHVFGHGTYAQLKAAELEATTRRGNLNSFLYTNELWSLQSNLSSSGTYDVAVCHWTNATQDGLQTLQPTYKKELIIGILAASTVTKAAIVAILAAL